MKKRLVILAAGIFFSVFTFAQTIKQQTQRALEDPKAAENAAKADVLLIDKKTVKDSTVYNAAPATTKKERSCLFKRKKKNKNP